MYKFLVCVFFFSFKGEVVGTVILFTHPPNDSCNEGGRLDVVKVKDSDNLKLVRVTQGRLQKK